jgi:hypothetical protein
MSDTAALSANLDQYQRAATTLREVAKWTVGGLAAAAAVVIAGSPLTGLGSLDWGWRLALVIGGACAGFVGLGSVVWRSMDLLVPRPEVFRGLLDGTSTLTREDKHLQEKLRSLFPVGTKSFLEIGECEKKYDDKLEKWSPSDPGVEQAKTFKQQVITLQQNFAYNKLLNRFYKIRKTIFSGGAFMIIGFGVFAWAANPANRFENPLADPYVRPIEPKPSDLIRMRAAVSDACLRRPIAVLVLSEHRSGDLDGVVLPSEECPPVRVVLRDGGRSIALVKR